MNAEAQKEIHRTNTLLVAKINNIMIRRSALFPTLNGSSSFENEGRGSHSKIGNSMGRLNNRPRNSSWRGFGESNDRRTVNNFIRKDSSDS